MYRLLIFFVTVLPKPIITFFCSNRWHWSELVVWYHIVDWTWKLEKRKSVVVAHIYLPVTAQHQTLNIGRSEHFSLQWLLRGWRNLHPLKSFQWSKVPVNFVEFLSLNLLLVRSHQAEIIIVKRLIQGRNNVTRVGVEPRSCDQSRRKNDAFTLSATLSTNRSALTGSSLRYRVLIIVIMLLFIYLLLLISWSIDWCIFFLLSWESDCGTVEQIRTQLRS